MRATALFIASLLCSRPAWGETALQAVQHLPREQTSRVARVEARDGTPEPDRWYIVTHDPAADNGVHEFVVANGEIVASRPVSQFADSLKPGDVLDPEQLKIDSDRAAKLARDYADANGAVVASMNYELRKEGPDAAPVWTVSCLDEKGEKVGALVITSGKGTVVSHDGFRLDPPRAAPDDEKPKKAAARFDTYAPPQVAHSDAAATGTDGANPGPDDTDGSKPGHHRYVKHPVKKENGVQKTFDSVGRTLHKILPF